MVGVRMKKLELRYVIVECPSDMSKNIIDKIDKETNRIVDFFNIIDFGEKVKIKIWDNLELFRDFVKEKNAFLDKNGNVADWLCGITYDNHIDTLKLDEYRKTKYHENSELKDMINLVLHEFVHACHDKKRKKENISKWLSEGLATTISGQYNGKDLSFDIDLADLEVGNIDYINYYTMFYYVLKKYGKDYVMNLINDFDLQVRETEKLYYETKNFVKVLNNFIDKFPILEGSKIEPYVILIDGYTGMGKSMVSKCISKFDGSIILNNDEVRYFLNDYKNNNYRLLQEYRLEKLLKNNNSCVIDSCLCHNYKSKLEYYKRLGIKYYIIRLECSDSIVKERLENRIVSNENYSIANYEDYLWMVNNVERVPKNLIDFIINTKEDISSQVLDFLTKNNLIERSILSR